MATSNSSMTWSYARGSGGSGKKDAYSLEVSRAQVKHLSALYKECGAASASCATIARQLLVNGVRLFYGDEELTNLPAVLRRWVDDGWVSRFVRDCVRQLACFGICVCRVHKSTMEASVVDLRLLSITMHVTKERGTEYEIVGTGGSEDTAYFIQVMHAPDAVTGETQGTLSKITDAFCEMKLYARNALVRDTTNSEALFLLENPNGERAVQGYMTATRSAGEVGGPLAQTLVGYSVSIDTVLGARGDIKEEMWLHSGQFARNVAADLGERRTLKMLRSGYPVADDVNPSECNMQPVEPGVTARQRAALPGIADALPMELKNERKIYTAFGVPWAMVEEHTGAHTNTMDTDNNQLQQTTDAYIGPVQTILENVSMALFKQDTLQHVYEQLQKIGGRRQDISRGSKKDAAALEAVLKKTESGDEPLTLRVMTVMQRRHMQLLYENGLLKHNAYVEYLVSATKTPLGMFETRDVRPIMVEPEEAGGRAAKGPGHHGESTLSREKEQQQTRDPTATLERKRKKTS